MSLLARFGPGYRHGFPVLPGALPVVGHFLALFDDAVGTLQRAAKELGPVFWVFLGPRRDRLFVMGRESFDLFKSRSVSMQNAMQGLDIIAAGSAVVMDGVEHSQVRGAMNPTFSPRGIAGSGIGEIMAQVVTARTESFLARAGEPIAALSESQELALDIIFRFAGVPAAELPTWKRQYRELILLLYPIPFNLPGFPKYRAARAAEWLNSELAKLIADVRARGTTSGSGGDTQGFLRGLLNAKDDQGRPLSDRQLIDNLRVLLFAGHETTASLLGWMLLLLATQPRLWERLLDEVNGAKEKRVPLNMAEAKAFPFAEAMFRETVRRYSPIWMTARMVSEPISYRGYTIPVGTRIGLPLGCYSMDPELYENPRQFLPDRFLNRPSPPSPIELSQFGGGPHFCLGYHLSWLESVQFLVSLALTMGERKLRPYIGDGPALRERFFPLRQPPRDARVIFR